MLLTASLKQQQHASMSRLSLPLVAAAAAAAAESAVFLPAMLQCRLLQASSMATITKGGCCHCQG
jgi:hypothetical protein